MHIERSLSLGVARCSRHFLGALGLFLAGVAGCADTTSFKDGSIDSGREAGLGEEIFFEASVLPDGFGDAGGKMYAHSGDTLLSIDPSTLKVTKIGTFAPNAPHMNDLAITPKGEMYVISLNDLYKVEAATAKITWVAKVTGTANVSLTFEVKGTLLASDKAGALRRIDPKTGVVTEIGTYGSGLGSSGDLVAIKDGTLFGVNDVGTSAKSNNQLLKIDPSTGKATVIGSIGYSQVWGLAFWKGTVYGLVKTGEFIAIDPKTGKGTFISDLGYELWGAAVTPLAPID